MEKGTKGESARTETCSNCGQLLSKSNIRFARDEAGLPDEALLFFYPPYIRAALAALPRAVHFYCPRYDPVTETCVAYGTGDERIAARWQTIGEHIT